MALCRELRGIAAIVLVRWVLTSTSCVLRSFQALSGFCPGSDRSTSRPPRTVMFVSGWRAFVGGAYWAR